MAADVSALIDTDANRQLTPAEVERYARRVLADLALEANGDALSLRLTGVQAPTIDEMMAGLGTIRITAIGDRPGIGRGRVRLHYRNNHQGPSSVYLVNALVPRDGSIRGHSSRLETLISRRSRSSSRRRDRRCRAWRGCWPACWPSAAWSCCGSDSRQRLSLFVLLSSFFFLLSSSLPPASSLDRLDNPNELRVVA